jgi:hypothetical protein
MVPLTELSKTHLGFMKSVQCGFQNNSHESTSANVWQSSKAYWGPIVIKLMLFWDPLLPRLRCRSTITLQKANANLWNENIRHLHPPSNRTSKLNDGREKWCWQFFLVGGSTRANFGTLPKRGTAANSVRYTELLRE